MNIVLTLPILVPFLTAIICIFSWNNRNLQRWLSVGGGGGLLLAAVVLLGACWRNGVQSTQIGDWPAPFGITFVADLFSAIMVVMTGLMALSISVYSLAGMDAERESFGYYPLVHIMLMGVCGSFLTGDVFNLYVWFEVMLIASFVLVVLGGEKPQLEGGIKYLTLNLISSALFLTGVGVLYGIAGTLNMADLAIRLPEIRPAGIVTTVSMLFLLAFGIKAAIFPLFFWLPASYHTPPVSISAIFAGLLTKVGVYALIRFFTLLFTHDTGTTHTLILVLSGLTMVVGVLGAVAQYEFRRLLSFHIVSQIGYMVMGLGLFTPLGLAGSIFHIVHNILSKTNLFLVSGVAHRLKGTYDLKKLGGLYTAAPGLTVLFLISAFSLAGMPPFSGFWSKLVLVKAGLETEQYTLVAAALAVGLLTTYSMTKIWNEAFWKQAPSETEAAAESADTTGRWSALFGPIVLLAVLIVTLGLFTEPFVVLFMRAAEQLMNPSEYILAVLGAES